MKQEQLDPRPFSFRCSSELRDEILRRAEVSGTKSSAVIRQVLKRSIAESSVESQHQRIAELERVLGDLLLQNSQLIDAVGKLGLQLRVGVEAVLGNLEPDGRGVPKEWLDRRFPPLFPVGEVG